MSSAAPIPAKARSRIPTATSSGPAAVPRVAATRTTVARPRTRKGVRRDSGVLCRYVLAVEPLASASHDEIVALLAPAIQRYLDG